MAGQGESATLLSLVKAGAVPFDVLHERYGGLLELVRTLIGVVPNCDPYLEIWPTAFRTYNVMVPNFLNLPFTVWGFGAPKEVLGLAMYAASMKAGCMYCSAHTCSFALRRGATPDDVARAGGEDVSELSPAARAAIAVARALSGTRSSLTAAHRQALEAQLPGADAEWVVLSIGMMGFLNKFMDALGVELEPSTVDEVSAVISPSGWSPGKHMDGGQREPNGQPPHPDGLWTKARVVRYAPGALSLDKKWTRGVPDRWPQVGAYLKERTGHDFPVLSRLTRRRAIRALATMLRDNLDVAESVVGIPAKLAAGLELARVTGDSVLEAQLRALGPAHADSRVEALARAIAPSPARVSSEVVAQCSGMSPAAVVEIVTFVSVMQLLHRVEGYYAP
jgi:alkylhydroperoxidase family enzyme